MSQQKNQGIALSNMRSLTRRQVYLMKYDFKQQVVGMYVTGMYVTLVMNMSWFLLAGVFDSKKNG